MLNAVIVGVHDHLHPQFHIPLSFIEALRVRACPYPNLTARAPTSPESFALDRRAQGATSRLV